MQEENRKVAVVTGGSRGIGAAIAKLLGANGYSVAINYVNDQAAAQKVLDHLTGIGSRAVGIQGDVSREVDVLRIFEIAQRELGPIRALVNNAAITGGFARVDQIDGAKLARMLAVNVAGNDPVCAGGSAQDVDSACRRGRSDREHFFVGRTNRQRGRMGTLRGIEGRGEHLYHRTGTRGSERRDSR